MGKRLLRALTRRNSRRDGGQLLPDVVIIIPGQEYRVFSSRWPLKSPRNRRETAYETTVVAFEV